MVVRIYAPVGDDDCHLYIHCSLAAQKWKTLVSSQLINNFVPILYEEEQYSYTCPPSIKGRIHLRGLKTVSLEYNRFCLCLMVFNIL